MISEAVSFKICNFKNVDKSTSFELFGGDIIFDNVVFSYPSRPDITILDKISLEIKSGQKVALVGASGGQQLLPTCFAPPAVSAHFAHQWPCAAQCPSHA